MGYRIVFYDPDENEHVSSTVYETYEDAEDAIGYNTEYPVYIDGIEVIGGYFEEE